MGTLQTVLCFLSVICWPSHAFVVEQNGTESTCPSGSSNKYQDALAKAILFFEGQRSGRLPSRRRVRWRGDSALEDGQLENVTLRGGYYDAGDNVKFVWPMSFSVTLLSWAATEYTAQIDSAGQIDCLQNAILWGTNFILKAHSSSTTLYTQVGDGNSDHQCWERPEDMDTPRTLYKISATSPGTEAAADSAAALASAYLVFNNINALYSSHLLKSSKSLFRMANKYMGSYQCSCPFYCSYNGYQDELLWAAIWLFKATDDIQYLRYLIKNKGWSRSATEFSWDNKLVGAQTLIAKEYMEGNQELVEYKNDMDSFVCSVMPMSGSNQIKTTPGGLLFMRDSANLQYATGASLVLSMYSNSLRSAGDEGVQCGSQNLSVTDIRNFAKSQLDYILGTNPMNYSYMVGFGSKYPNRVHHRGASMPSIKAYPLKIGCKDGFSSWFTSSNPNPNTHVGAIVGGPDSNDQFFDERSDSSHSEPATYINAAFVGLVAASLGEEVD